ANALPEQTTCWTSRIAYSPGPPPPPRLCCMAPSLLNIDPVALELAHESSGTKVYRRRYSIVKSSFDRSGIFLSRSPHLAIRSQKVLNCLACGEPVCPHLHAFNASCSQHPANVTRRHLG